MSATTKIEWADSTLNLQMGCDGCELWNGTRKSCYAGQLTERWGGKPGWPRVFTEPRIFLDRLDQLERMKDLAGTERPDKPWLNGLPRMVFLNDMGDTFTESLPLNWLEPALPRLAALPHIIMILTKRAHRMREFFTAVGVPSNFWLYVSVTQRGQNKRITDLLAIPGKFTRGLSLEPQIEAVRLWKLDTLDYDGNAIGYETYPLEGLQAIPDCDWEHPKLDHVIQGGESGRDARPFDLAWVRSIRDECNGKTAYFLKQVGGFPVEYREVGTAKGGAHVPLRLRDPKGGDPSEWPDDLQNCRAMPSMEARNDG